MNQAPIAQQSQATLPPIHAVHLSVQQQVGQGLVAKGLGYLALLLIGAAACTNANGTGGSDAGINCGAGQKVAYDANTGAPKCVDISDANITQDGSTVADNGATTGSDLGNSTGGDTGPIASDVVGDAVADAVAPTKTSNFDCPVNSPTKDGLLHGKACTKDGDCKYGVCYFGAPIAGYDASIGICTKNCNCAGAASNCTADDTDLYRCVFETTAENGNPKRSGDQPPVKMCARTCSSDLDCAAWNPALPDCIQFSTKFVSVPAVKVCGKDPFKGG